jgi:hypothetical protein
MEITPDIIKTVLSALGKNTDKNVKEEENKTETKEDTKVETKEDTKVDVKEEDNKTETKEEDNKTETKEEAKVETKEDTTPEAESALKEMGLIEEVVKKAVDSKLKELEEKNEFYRACSEAGLDSKNTKLAEDVIFSKDFKQIIELLSQINKTVPNSVISNTDKIVEQKNKINTPGIY